MAKKKNWAVWVGVVIIIILLPLSYKGLMLLPKKLKLLRDGFRIEFKWTEQSRQAGPKRLRVKSKKRRRRKKRRRYRRRKRYLRRYSGRARNYHLEISFQIDDKKPNGELWDRKDRKDMLTRMIDSDEYKADPFAVMTIGGRRLLLKTIVDSHNPRWYSRSRFYMAGNERLTLVISDNDKPYTHDLIGGCRKFIPGFRYRRSVMRFRCGSARVKIVFKR